MVRFKRNLPLPEQGKTDNTYRAIGVANKCRAKSPLSKDVADFIDLEQQLDRETRKELGLLDYGDCTLAELRILAESRHLEPGGSPWRLDYNEILQAADDEFVFDKFLELPSELRNNIYQQYFQALPPLPTRPHQPPLTLVSRLVREEALPFYYEESTFALKIYSRFRTYDVVNGRWTVWGLSPRSSSKLDCHIKSHSLLGSGRLRAEDLARIQHVHVHVFHKKADVRGTQFIGHWKIDLSGKQDPVVTRPYDTSGMRRDPDVVYRDFVSSQEVIKAITSVVEKVRTRRGPGKLRQSDVLAIGAATFKVIDDSRYDYW